MTELCTKEDLSEMCIVLKCKREVLLWCYENVGEQSTVQAQKRTAQATNDSAPSSKRQAVAKSISKIEDIIKRLNEKCSDTFSVEKLGSYA